MVRSAAATSSLVILMGLQASGKSTFVRERLADTHVVVSKDDWPNARHKQRRMMALVHGRLAAGDSVVIDNTNPSSADREPLIRAAKDRGVRVVGYWFNSSLKACARRNLHRDGRERVPDVGLYATAARLRPPTMAEGFDELYLVRL
jgi:predicted kinase